MKRTFALLISTILFIEVFAQTQLSVKVGSNYSMSKDIEEKESLFEIYYIPIIYSFYQSKPGLDIGLTLKTSIREGVNFLTSLTIETYKFKYIYSAYSRAYPLVNGHLIEPYYFYAVYVDDNRYEDILVEEGEDIDLRKAVINSAKDADFTTNTYITIPICLGFTLFDKKLSVYNGAKFSLFVNSSLEVEKWDNDLGENVDVKDSEKFTNFFASPYSLISYRIFDKVSINAEYSMVLKPLYKDMDGSQLNYKNIHCFNLGLMYDLVK